MENKYVTLDGECEGHLLNAYTYDYKRFNEMIGLGVSIQEILESEIQPIPIRHIGNSYGNCFYLIYEYTVDGITYVRANNHGIETSRAVPSGTPYVRSRLKNIYRINYSKENPGISTMNNSKIGVMPTTNYNMTSSTNMNIQRRKNPDSNCYVSMFASIFAIGFFFFFPISIVASCISISHGIKGLKDETDKKNLAKVGIGLSIAAIALPIIIAIAIVILFAINGGMY